MYQKFQVDDKVRHREGSVIMTVTNYVTKKEYTEPRSMLGGDRKFILVPTEYLNCRWLDKETNTYKSDQFNQKDLVKVDN